MLDDYPKQIDLRDGETATLRIATRDDQTRLVLFFLSIPEAQRDFVPYDLSEEENLQGWFGGPNWEEAFPIIAEVGPKIVGIALLKGYRARWSHHVGECWLIVHENMRGLKLGRIIASDMCGLASELGIEYLKTSLRADDEISIAIFKKLGYNLDGVRPNYIRDVNGDMHGLAMMTCDVAAYLKVNQETDGHELDEANAVLDANPTSKNEAEQSPPVGDEDEQ